MKTPDVCPNCGAILPPKSRACPVCGSDEHTGWSDDALADPLGLEDTFDYQDFVNREFSQPKLRPRGIAWFWWLVAVALLVAFIFWLTRLPW